jgi:hypothetical protein
MSKEKNTLNINELPDSLIIAPIYPDTVFFTVQATIRKQTIVKGRVEGFHDKTSEVHELYFQRFVEKQGSYRVIHCVGTSLETINEFGRETHKLNEFKDTIKFDDLGIFDGEPGDPVDLIPLYPGHPISPGEFWHPEARVNISLGSGVAKYSFVIDSLYRDENGSLLAFMQIELNGDLQPIPEFQRGKVTVSGEGWIEWDCTINQRRKTHITATYRAIEEQNGVIQFISVDDELQVNKGRKEF